MNSNKKNIRIILLILLVSSIITIVLTSKRIAYTEPTTTTSQMSDHDIKTAELYDRLEEMTHGIETEGPYGNGPYGRNEGAVYNCQRILDGSTWNRKIECKLTSFKMNYMGQNIEILWNENENIYQAVALEIGTSSESVRSGQTCVGILFWRKCHPDYIEKENSSWNEAGLVVDQELAIATARGLKPFQVEVRIDCNAESFICETTTISVP